MAVREEGNKLEFNTNKINNDFDTNVVNAYKKSEEILNGISSFTEKIPCLIDVWKQARLYSVQPQRNYVIHLMDWLKRHTLNIILTGDWKKYKDVYEEILIKEVTHCELSFKKNNPNFSLRCKKLAEIIRDPWGNHVLCKLLNCTDMEITQEELEFFAIETGYIISMRLKMLCESHCEDLALNLATSCLKCYRIAEERRFNINATEDQKRFILDTYIALLYKYKKTATILSILKTLSLQQGLELVKRFSNKRINISKIWRYSKKITHISAQVYITAAVMRPPEESFGILKQLLNIWLSLDVNSEESLVQAIRRIIQAADSAVHMYVFCELIYSKFPSTMKIFTIELFIRALTTDMNDLERQKNEENTQKVEEITERLATGFLHLANVLNDHINVSRECVLTAFSLQPTDSTLQRIIELAKRSGCEVLDTGQMWKCRLHPPANPADEILWKCIECGEEMSQPEFPTLLNTDTALSDALVAEKLGLSSQLCDDLAVVIAGPRYQIFSWRLKWIDLHNLCVLYLNDPDRTKNLVKELKFVQIDYSMFTHIKKEPEDDLTGIEKGYEMYLEEDDGGASEDSVSQDSRLNDLGSDGTGESPLRLFFPPPTRQSNPDVLKSLRMFRPNLKRTKEHQINDSLPRKVFIGNNPQYSGENTVSSNFYNGSTSFSYFSHSYFSSRNYAMSNEKSVCAIAALKSNQCYYNTLNSNSAKNSVNILRNYDTDILRNYSAGVANSKVNQQLVSTTTNLNSPCSKDLSDRANNIVDEFPLSLNKCGISSCYKSGLTVPAISDTKNENERLQYPEVQFFPQTDNHFELKTSDTPPYHPISWRNQNSTSFLNETKNLIHSFDHGKEKCGNSEKVTSSKNDFSSLSKVNCQATEASSKNCCLKGNSNIPLKANLQTVETASKNCFKKKMNTPLEVNLQTTEKFSKNCFKEKINTPLELNSLTTEKSSKKFFKERTDTALEVNFQAVEIPSNNCFRERMNSPSEVNIRTTETSSKNCFKERTNTLLGINLQATETSLKDCLKEKSDIPLETDLQITEAYSKSSFKEKINTAPEELLKLKCVEFNNISKTSTENCIPATHNTVACSTTDSKEENIIPQIPAIISTKNVEDCQDSSRKSDTNSKVERTPANNLKNNYFPCVNNLTFDASSTSVNTSKTVRYCCNLKSVNCSQSNADLRVSCSIHSDNFNTSGKHDQMEKDCNCVLSKFKLKEVKVILNRLMIPPSGMNINPSNSTEMKTKLEECLETNSEKDLHNYYSLDPEKEAVPVKNVNPKVYVNKNVLKNNFLRKSSLSPMVLLQRIQNINNVMDKHYDGNKTEGKNHSKLLSEIPKEVFKNHIQETNKDAGLKRSWKEVNDENLTKRQGTNMERKENIEDIENIKHSISEEKKTDKDVNRKDVHSIDKNKGLVENQKLKTFGNSYENIIKSKFSTKNNYVENIVKRKVNDSSSLELKNNNIKSLESNISTNEKLTFQGLSNSKSTQNLIQKMDDFFQKQEHKREETSDMKIKQKVQKQVAQEADPKEKINEDSSQRQQDVQENTEEKLNKKRENPKNIIKGICKSDTCSNLLKQCKNRLAGLKETSNKENKKQLKFEATERHNKQIKSMVFSYEQPSERKRSNSASYEKKQPPTKRVRSKSECEETPVYNNILNEILQKAVLFQKRGITYPHMKEGNSNLFSKLTKTLNSPQENTRLIENGLNTKWKLDSFFVSCVEGKQVLNEDRLHLSNFNNNSLFNVLMTKDKYWREVKRATKHCNVRRKIHDSITAKQANSITEMSNDNFVKEHNDKHTVMQKTQKNIFAECNEIDNLEECASISQTIKKKEKLRKAFKKHNMKKEQISAVSFQPKTRKKSLNFKKKRKSDAAGKMASDEKKKKNANEEVNKKVDSVLNSVPGLNDLEMIRPRYTDPLVQVVQVGDSTVSNTSATQTQPSTQITPHIQRIGQPRTDKSENSVIFSASLNSSGVVTSLATSTTASTKNTTSSKSTSSESNSTIINILQNQVCSTSQMIRPIQVTPVLHPTGIITTHPIQRTRAPPVINILSQQIIRPATIISCPPRTASVSINTETPNQVNNVPQLMSTSDALVTQLGSPGRVDTTSTLKAVVDSTSSEPNRIVQLLCKSSDGKLIPVTSLTPSKIVKVAVTQVTSTTSSNSISSNSNLEGDIKKLIYSGKSNAEPVESSDTLPKFQQAFGKSYQGNLEVVTSDNENNDRKNTVSETETVTNSSNKVQLKGSSIKNLQHVQGSVIYRKQAVGQTINLIPPGRGQVFRIATSNTEQISLVKDSIIQNKMNALLTAALQGKQQQQQVTSKSTEADSSSEDSLSQPPTTIKITQQHQALLSNARVIKPVVHVSSNVIRSASNAQGNLSSTTLEQLREFDMVYKQVKERSNITGSSETQSENNEPAPQISVTYLNQSQKLNCAPVVVVSSYCTLQSSTSPVISTATQGSSSPCVTSSSSVSFKSTSRNPKLKTIKTNIAHPSKISPIPKPQQKPQEDEHTTQRIFDILAEYAEQLRNSPDLNNKPAPRRRSNPPTNPSQSSKRKKSSGTKKIGAQSGSSGVVTSDTEVDDSKTVCSEDSSGGVVQISLQDEDLSTVAITSSETLDTPANSKQLLLTEANCTQTRNLILADANVGETFKVSNATVLVPGNYIMPVSMVKSGQQITVVSGNSKILATMPARSGPNMLLFQSFLNQSRKSNITNVKCSPVQSVAGISSQTVNSHSSVILPTPQTLTSIALGQSLAIKKTNDSDNTEVDNLNTEYLLTISNSNDNNSSTAVEDTIDLDSSTDCVSERDTSEENNEDEKKMYRYEKPQVSTSTSTSVISQSSSKNEISADSSPSTQMITKKEDSEKGVSNIFCTLFPLGL